jgi:hypothetical protein
VGIRGQHLTETRRAEIKEAIRTAPADTVFTELAERFNVHKTTVYALKRELTNESKPATFPSFVVDGDDEEPIEEIIRRMERNFTRSKAARDQKRWFRVEVPDDKPVGILFFGDPHLDDNGCNWPVLKRHVQLCKETPGLYGANIGDTTNCWGGKLVRLYANQDTSVRTARRLAEWFLLESEVRWLLWLMGNHEHMGDGGPVLEEMNRRYGTTTIPMLDWKADFILSVGGAEFKVSAAHDFPGNSMWNPVHGVVKAAKFGDQIDVLVCGHKHNWAISQWELAEQGNAPLMVRARGYKHMDEHGTRHGFGDQEEGQAVLVIFDPASKSRAGRVHAFVDVDRGADVLTYLRSR